MTKTENEIIAEFMGYKWIGEHWFDDHMTKNAAQKTGCFVEVVKYDTSWDWLMPVVDKIESLKIKVYQDDEVKNGTLADFQFKRGRNNSYLCLVSYFEHDGGQHKHSRSYTGRIIAEDGVRLKSVHTAVVEFIKWYNSNPTSS